MKVIGIDENGYGPVLGPLVVTGACFELKEEIRDVEILLERLKEEVKILESKKNFKSSKGKSFALSLLKMFTREEGPQESIIFSPEILSCGRKEKIFCFDPYLFNARLKKLLEGVSENPFKSDLFQPSGFISKIICVRDFNKMCLNGLKKTQILFSEIENLIRAFLPQEKDLIICDNISGTKNYSHIFDSMKNSKRIDDKTTIGFLNLERKKLKVVFAINGDERFFPVSIASNIGKLMRELSMDFFNMALKKNFEKDFFRISGYRDSITSASLKYVRSTGMDEMCLLRRK